MGFVGSGFLGDFLPYHPSFCNKTVVHFVCMKVSWCLNFFRLTLVFLSTPFFQLLLK
jgi:hypothetical protein